MLTRLYALCVGHDPSTVAAIVRYAGLPTRGESTVKGVKRV
jgi:hypothetical protein